MKAREAELVPAPKRGRYDRALTRRERQDAQRERVITAIAALSHGELSVASVVELAGIGRNTFYEYFDDIEHALMAVNSRALREFALRIDTALRAARTPVERIRALARAWAENLFENPALARLSLRAQPEVVAASQLSILGQHIVHVLNAQHAAQSALPGFVDPLRVSAVAALFDTVGRLHLGGHPMTAEELQRVLAELAQRLLR